MKTRRQVILVGTVAVLVALGIGLAGLYWVRSTFDASETNDVAEYPGWLKRWADSGLVSHFPPSVPPHARNVKFAAFPGILQAGAYIQLRMQLPADEVAAIQAQLEQATTHVYAGGGMFDHYNRDTQNNWPTTVFRTADDPQTTFYFPEHYTLHVLSAKDRGGNWNHGDTSGIAVSTTAGEVIYWADSW